MNGQDKIVNGNSWIAFFDLLGFKRMMDDFTSEHGEGHLDIFVQTYYIEILDELVRKQNYWPDHVFSAWASDSFLFFTRDDSIESFTCILQSASHFFCKLIWTKMPVRGSLTLGRFYGDLEKSVFVGPSLIDAYKYAGSLNLIGFALTPKATSRLKEKEPALAGPGADLVQFDVPLKDNKGNRYSEQLLMYKFGKLPMTFRCIQQMKKEAEIRNCNQSVLEKYRNTLEFLQKTCPK